jgi:hypothetical protein
MNLFPLTNVYIISKRPRLCPKSSSSKKTIKTK